MRRRCRRQAFRPEPAEPSPTPTGLRRDQRAPPVGRPGDFEVLLKTRVIGDKHIRVGAGFHPREPLRHEGGIDGSNDARVIQLVGQLGAASPRVCLVTSRSWRRDRSRRSRSAPARSVPSSVSHTSRCERCDTHLPCPPAVSHPRQLRSGTFRLLLHRRHDRSSPSRSEHQGALEPLGATSEAPARCARAAGTSRDSRASARPVRGRQRSRAAPPAAANGTRSRR